MGCLDCPESLASIDKTSCPAKVCVSLSDSNAVCALKREEEKSKSPSV